MQIKTLANVPVETVHQAFVAAFSDYEVPIAMPLEKFQEMMQTRDLNPEYSYGYFDNNRLVGFIICGYREINHRKFCYDGGTGVIKDFRRTGIGEELLKESIRQFKHQGIQGLILEVLENNQAAIDLYAKNGFQKIRKLKCFESQKNEIGGAAIPADCTTDENIANYRRLDYMKYMTFQPSWQNEKQSVENVIANYAYVSLLHQNEVMGYGLIHKLRGDIPQIGVLDPWKDKGLEAVIVSRLVERTQSDRITCLNVQENDYLKPKLAELGFTNFVSQYEMKLELNGG